MMAERSLVSLADDAVAHATYTGDALSQIAFVRLQALSHLNLSRTTVALHSATASFSSGTTVEVVVCY
jgi:hypothetical protein